MKQLLLDLFEEEEQSLGTFAPGMNNHELLQLMQQVRQRRAPEHMIYLWGETASGKTHLLHALQDNRACLLRALPGRARMKVEGNQQKATLYLLDDCQYLSASAQIDAFALYNQIKERGAWLVASGNLPPADLPLREDLRTRLGWGLIYQLHPLSDEEKIAALEQTAKSRDIKLAPGVLPYLITHFRRDMRSLSGMLTALDKYSLETKRPITLPLLRKLLQQDAST
ncbi:DnaA regulatory inactivator Hda [Massilia sp. W12]|uniref:DnaA regulatory inactivator Hda n=1 Tax=Massilia sp. W12 TaxID=3126507 RepID=UPI0030CB4B6E